VLPGHQLPGPSEEEEEEGEDTFMNEFIKWRQVSAPSLVLNSK
jgi:hypothetical protein